MARDEKILANESLVRAWQADETDEYTRCVLGSMLAESRNPNDRGHTGPMSIEVCERWARGEREAQAEHPICAHAAAVLESLATKLHDYKPAVERCPYGRVHHNGTLCSACTDS